MYLKIHNIIHNTEKSIQDSQKKKKKKINSQFDLCFNSYSSNYLIKKKKTIVPSIIDFIDHSKHVARCPCMPKSRVFLSNTNTHYQAPSMSDTVDLQRKC